MNLISYLFISLTPQYYPSAFIVAIISPNWRCCIGIPIGQYYLFNYLLSDYFQFFTYYYMNDFHHHLRRFARFCLIFIHFVFFSCSYLKIHRLSCHPLLLLLLLPHSHLLRQNSSLRLKWGILLVFEITPLL